MSENKKIINPLLNASVTGGTLEDFTQNAVLLPAAELPPPPILETTPQTETTSGYHQHVTQDINQQITRDLIDNPLDQPIRFDSFVAQSEPLQEEDLNPPPIQQQQQPQQPTLQSVFSSFSSYLKLGSKPTEPEIPKPVPSVVDNLLNQTPDINAPPVTFYTPNENPIVQSIINAPPAGATNTYRRGGLKRPAYAPIPGLSQGTPIPSVQQPSGFSGYQPNQPFQNQPPLPFLPPTSQSTIHNLPAFQPSQINPPLNPLIPSQPPNVQSTIPNLTPFQPSQIYNPPPLTDSFHPNQFTTPIQPPKTQPPLQTPITYPPLEPPQSDSPFITAIQPPITYPPLEPPVTYPPLQPPQSHSPFIAAIQPPKAHSPFVPPIQPPKSHSPFAIQPSNLPFAPIPTRPYSPSIGQQNIPVSPPKLPNTFNYFLPELSGYATSSQGNITVPESFAKCTELDRPRTPDSPILKPLSESEVFYGLNTSQSFTYSEPNTMSATITPEVRNVLNEGEGQVYMYRPVYNHWFFKREIEGKVIWTPFTMSDSLNLDTAYLSIDLTPDKIVATDGGRYDVNILRRERTSVYWTSPPNEVRRCSWFHKGNNDGRYVPYEENISTRLEEEYKIAHESNTWNRKVELANGENVIFHGPDVLVLFPQSQSPDAWGNTPNQPRPRVVKRGMDEFHIEEGEPNKVDHLLFLVHGIGSVCDLKFRSVEEVVDEFRSISLQLVQSHYRSSCETGLANRVEVLPISWHEKLHSEDTGVDKKLKGITLESIPRLRDFTNDTILDVLFYTSPVYCQTIISSVANEMNRIFELFKQRNPSFDGGVSLGGHSLGSLILFDILCHQHPAAEKTEVNEETEEDVISPLKPHPKDRHMSRRISYMMGSIGTGQPQLNYPHLSFNPKHFFALGSPIGMFVTVRGLDTLGDQFALPTCPAFYNIFHPYDPVAYRIESLVNPDLANLKPVLIPHHKGRKRMHLELKETMARVGADLKQKLMDSMKSTWNSFYQFTLFKSQTNTPNLEEEVEKVLEEQLNREQNARDEAEETNIETEPTDLPLGILNQGRRIDYVLQEAPLEFFNEYIFALTSHVCYWESEDTMLLILKEIYNSMNISTDSQIPQQTMTIERPPPSPNSLRTVDPLDDAYGVDPTLPMMPRTDIGPPPVAGFVRKS